MLSKNGIRASDDDRESVVALLRDAYVAGRLDLAGIRDRAGAAYAAQTWGQLQELTADLPGESDRPSWARPGAAAAPRPGTVAGGTTQSRPRC